MTWIGFAQTGGILQNIETSGRRKLIYYNPNTNVARESSVFLIFLKIHIRKKRKIDPRLEFKTTLATYFMNESVCMNLDVALKMYSVIFSLPADGKMAPLLTYHPIESYV